MMTTENPLLMVTDGGASKTSQPRRVKCCQPAGMSSLILREERDGFTNNTPGSDHVDIYTCRFTNTYRLITSFIHRGVYPAGGFGRAISHIFKSGRLTDWSCQLICCAYIVV